VAESPPTEQTETVLFTINGTGSGDDEDDWFPKEAEDAEVAVAAQRARSPILRFYGWVQTLKSTRRRLSATDHVQMEPCLVKSRVLPCTKA
jgi:hypothetical protein